MVIVIFGDEYIDILLQAHFWEMESVEWREWQILTTIALMKKESNVTRQIDFM